MNRPQCPIVCRDVLHHKLDSSFELLETPIPASVTLFKNPRQMFHGEDEKSNPNPVNLINKPDLLCQEEDSRHGRSDGGYLQNRGTRTIPVLISSRVKEPPSETRGRNGLTIGTHSCRFVIDSSVNDLKRDDIKQSGRGHAHVGKGGERDKEEGHEGVGQGASEFPQDSREVVQFVGQWVHGEV
jgi:hypothetical protein